MSLSLSSARDAVEIHLSDSSNLVFSPTMLDEAVRAALRALSGVYGSPQTLSGLDGAAATSFDPSDEHTLIMGAVAFALSFRAAGRFEDALPDDHLPPDLADLAQTRMSLFENLLTQSRIRKLQESTDTPYAAWDWDEGSGFS